MNRGDILHKIKYPVVILILIILIGLVAGCSNVKEAEKKPSSSSAKADLPPALESIRSELEKLIPQLEQSTQILLGYSSGPGREDEQKDSSASGEESKAKDGQEEQGSPSKSAGEQPSSEQQDSWGKIAEGVKAIHQSWNEVEDMVIKEGLSTDTRDEFEKALEELTLKIDEKNIEASLFAALDVYRYYPDMLDLFNSKIPAEFFRLQYELMLIRDESGREKWEEAMAELPSFKTQWDILKKSEALKDEKISKKAENAVRDLENAVEKQEACLVQIKSEILMKNMDEIEQKFINAM